MLCSLESWAANRPSCWSSSKSKRERERERERETERQRETETETDRDRHTNREMTKLRRVNKNAHGIE